MKKLTILMAAAALVCFSVPAMAVDWNFYGNARFETFWTSEDFGDGDNAAGTDTKDQGLIWEYKSGSRVGANVKADHISAQVELGLPGSDAGGDGDVSNRRLYGVWNFGAGKLKVGKDYTPAKQFISGQVFDGDAGLLGRGFMYAGRPGQIALQFGGFEVALIENYGTSEDDDNPGDLNTGGDVDVSLPKLEASFDMAYDAFSWGVRGGAQTYEIEDVTTNAGGTEDVTVTSYIIGADAGFNFGPGYVKGGISYGRNLGAARWAGADIPLYDGDDDTEDVDTIQAGLVAGMKVSDMLSFEIGGGYKQNDPKDAPNGRDEKTKEWEIYGQSVILLAPGVYVIPEIGYIDKGDNFDDTDAGDTWYAGGKWQINF